MDDLPYQAWLDQVFGPFLDERKLGRGPFGPLQED